MGALDTLRRQGWDVPGEMSVMSVDDHPMSRLMNLTTIRQPAQRQGALAGRLVIDLLNRDAPELHTTLPTELVLRSTTGPPRPPGK